MKQIRQGRVPVDFQATREFSLAAPPRLRDQRSPEVADNHLSPLRNQRLTNLLPGLGVRPRVVGAPASVGNAIGARLLLELVLVHGRRGDEDDPRVVREDQGVREDGDEVLAVGRQRDVLLADSAEVA